jgi:hypothetical protein
MIGKGIAMRKVFYTNTKTGQSVLEYAILLSVLCMVFLTMFAYMHRAVQAKLVVVQDRVNEAVRQ